MKWQWPWKRKPKQYAGEHAELEQAKAQAEELARRTRRIIQENGLASDIRKALGIQ